MAKGLLSIAAGGPGKRSTGKREHRGRITTSGWAGAVMWGIRTSCGLVSVAADSLLLNVATSTLSVPTVPSLRPTRSQLQPNGAPTLDFRASGRQGARMGGCATGRRPPTARWKSGCRDPARRRNMIARLPRQRSACARSAGGRGARRRMRRGAGVVQAEVQGLARWDQGESEQPSASEFMATMSHESAYP